MPYYKRKPGESLVIDTKHGPIVIRMFAGEQLIVEVPDGLKVTASKARKKAAPAESWLPSRPDPKKMVA